MKSFYKLFFYLLPAVSLWSCQETSKGIEYIDLTKEDIKDKITILKSADTITLNIDSAGTDVTAFYLLKDTCILTQNSYKSSSLIDLYSLRHRKRIARLAPKGRGPGEFTECRAIVPSAGAGRFHLSDGRNFYTLLTDSVLADKKLKIVNSFHYSNGNLHPYIEVCPIDSVSYVGYNLWYIDDPGYNPRHIPELTKYDINSKSRPLPEITQVLFPGPVNGATLIINPDNKQIWSADWHKNSIKIYDTTLQIIKQISGPETYDLSYSTIDANNNLKMVVFPGNVVYKTYTGFTYTPDHVYIINEGIKGMDTNTYEKQPLNPVEVYKFSWDGELQCIYKLDKYISTISVSSDEKLFYCTAKDTLGGEPYLIVYQVAG